MTEEIIAWKDRDNPVYIKLQEDGADLSLEQMEAITKVEFCFNGVYYSSADNPTCFDLNTMKNESTVVVYPGLLPFPDDSVKQDYAAELIVYDSISQNGILWMRFHMFIRTVT